MDDKDKAGLDDSYGSGSAEENRRVYSEWAKTYDEEFAGSGGYQFGRLIAEAFVALGGTGPVLDAGCGTGLVADHLPDSLVVDGVDLSPDMLAVAEYITKVHAICQHCGNLATHSYRLSAKDDTVVLGEKDQYEARCRTCYHMGNILDLKTLHNGEADKEA